MKQSVFDGMEYVYAVYQAGSFQKAAEKLFISQPSISASVRRVEDRIGSQIFDRGMKPLGLTECGREYICLVEKIMAMEREFSEYVNDWEGLRRGRLVLGGSSFFSSLVLPSMMAAFREKYPRLTLELVEESTGKLEDMLDRGLIDLVVDYAIPNPEKYDAEILKEDHVILAVPGGNPVNQKLRSYRIPPEAIGTPAQSEIAAVPIELFRDEAFILMKPENDTRQRADALCASGGFRPKNAMEFDQQTTSYLVGCSGAGITFVSSILVSRLSPQPRHLLLPSEGTGEHPLRADLPQTRPLCDPGHESLPGNRPGLTCLAPPHTKRGDIFRVSSFTACKKPRRVCRPQAANRVRSFSAGACTWRKIPYRLQV